jgi:tRNA1(Val) A37 N6-methylase TrmN6
VLKDMEFVVQEDQKELIVTNPPMFKVGEEAEDA